MKKIVLLSLFICVYLFGAHQGIFQTVPKKDATILQKGEQKNSCPACGMNLFQFYKTSHAVKLKDGSYRQYCSLYCLVDELTFEYLSDKKDQIEQIIVVDAKTTKQTDANKAFYIIGSKMPGTMSIQSKYAFKEKSDALEFQKKYGGELMSFDEAVKATLKHDFGR
jgi:copper chaperone NosL